MDRRMFLGLAAGGAAAGTGLLGPLASATASPRYQAIAFDAFPVFDPRPVFALAETLFPGHGATLSETWRTRQFEYQWLRALSNRYADFRQTTEDALEYAARATRVELTAAKRTRLMQAYTELKAWPDALPALRSLREAGVRLVFLSNMTTPLLEAGIRNSGLNGVFDMILSTDTIKAFKPEPRAYQMAIDALGLRPEAILFAAFAGWDVAGAKGFGYPTFWVNRLGAPAEVLGAEPDATGRDLADLVSFVSA